MNTQMNSSNYNNLNNMIMNEYKKQYSNFIRHIEDIIKYNDAFAAIKALDKEKI